MLDTGKFSKMNVSDMQKEVDEYIGQFKEGYFSPMSQIVRFTEELGELAREVNHVYGDKKKKATEADGSISEELGDMFILCLILANSLDMDITEIYKKNMDKFTKRDKYRYDRKDGKLHD
ncbi:MAG: nucleotide pyrophosphohydrolase [Lactobacillales bacterium]|jgi:NTP pyrophosphatase (non-canonical NTP hydrolase)|nr:nucleotide pyrophosphohydrolase [Lactobacillales bacterium]